MHETCACTEHITRSLIFELQIHVALARMLVINEMNWLHMFVYAFIHYKFPPIRSGWVCSCENQTDVFRINPWLWYSTMPDVDGNIFEIWSQLELYWWFWTMEYSEMEMTRLSVLGSCSSIAGMKQNRWVQSLQSGTWHMPLWCADSWAVVLPFQLKPSTYPTKHRCGAVNPWFTSSVIEVNCAGGSG